MKIYRNSFPNENIYIHNHFYSDIKKFKYNYIFIWRVRTPTNKISKYWHTVSNNTGKTDKVHLPKLRKGYYWDGPYLY
jgi:hypothetical protein